MPCGLIKIRSLPAAIVFVAAFALAFGGMLRLSSPIQPVEVVSSSQSTCDVADCCDDLPTTVEPSPISTENPMLCCEHRGDRDCCCCHPIVGISLSIAELNRLRDSSEQIDQSIARLTSLPLQLRYAQLPGYLTKSHISNCESLLKLKSLLIV